MHRFARAAVAAAILAPCVLAADAQQRPDPDSPRYKGVVALAEFLRSDGPEAVEDFVESRIAVAVREAMDDESLRETLAAIRLEAAGAELRGGRPIGPLAAEVVLDHADGTEIAIEFALDEDDPSRFVLIRSPANVVGG